MEVVSADLSKFKKAKQWRREDAAVLFSTDGAWEWFKRTHRSELIASGSLIVRAGRAGDLVHTDRIGAVVQRILQTESLSKLNRTIGAA